MKTTRKIAFCGVLCALSTVVLLLTVFPFSTYALAALAGMVLIPAALECGTRYGVSAYAVTALLALLVTPDLEAKWLYVLLFGYYPIVQLRLMLWQKQVVAWMLKFILFNAAASIGYWILIRFCGVSPQDYAVMGMNIPLLLLAMGNVVFWLYDFVLMRVAAFYRVRLHPLVVRLFR